VNCEKNIVHELTIPHHGHKTRASGIAPFYDANISPEAIDGLNKFAKASGLIAEPIHCDRLVVSQFRHLWNN
jgi:hypothetical protein